MEYPKEFENLIKFVKANILVLGIQYLMFCLLEKNRQSQRKRNFRDYVK